MSDDAFAARALIKARRLLVAALDDRRAIVGRVSRAWIVGEVERRASWQRLSPRMQQRVSALFREPPKAVNTNVLPKLEPELNAHVLTGVILYGARLFGRGRPEIDHDLVIASMIHGTLGLRDTRSAFLPERQRIVDEAFLQRELGPGVLGRVRALRGHLTAFAEAHDRGLPMPAFPREFANAIAAIAVARLRLSARAAGDGIFSLLNDAQRAEVRAAGIEPGEPDDVFAERPFLVRDYEAAAAAIALPGVDTETIVEPVRDVLLRGIEHVLRHGTPPRELVGKYGSAIRNFHISLPLWDRYSPIVRRTVRNDAGDSVEVSGPFALGTLYRTSLEVTRYLHNVRRKGGGTAAGHCFLVSACIERLLESHLTIPLIAGSDCHDVVEDGGLDIAGYDQSLELFALRFGAPLAALVSEVTDPSSQDDGPQKAEATAAHPSLVPMETAYNLGQLAELRSRATDPDVPFTLHGIVMKLADFGATMEEGLHEPWTMTGVWRHSGARVHWDHTNKGRIIRPLVARLAVEIAASGSDPSYRIRPGHLPVPLIERLRQLLKYSFDVADLYAAQNVALLADEYGLDARQRQDLFDHLLATKDESDVPESRLDKLFDERRLDPMVREKGLAATHRLLPNGKPVRDLARLHDYFENARRRARTRAELELPPVSQESVAEMLLQWESSREKAVDPEAAS